MFFLLMWISMSLIGLAYCAYEFHYRKQYDMMGLYKYFAFTTILMMGVPLIFAFSDQWTQHETGLAPAVVAYMISGLPILLLLLSIFPTAFRPIAYAILKKYRWGRVALISILVLNIVVGLVIPIINNGIPQAYFHDRERERMAALEQQERLNPKAAALNWLAKVENKYDLLDDGIRRDLSDLCFTQRVWGASYQEALSQHWSWDEEDPYFNYADKQLKLLNQIAFHTTHQSIKNRNSCFHGAHLGGGQGFSVKNDQSLFSVDSVTASESNMELTQDQKKELISAATRYIPRNPINH
ncbi:hypothetical protein RP726_05600 [Candidatus Methylospira mobilis]|uniref:hypothetical protein n=1 Tax=Candidatus Methylospira mobilis TaxID=1808979 RepID=UPI0028EB525E|nr:hypothetical protein [Candidatus Methylospira mobilis]WNV05886.1 hypothetical protein RP726_05600 [Candidatus Methylospira mobilis]